MKWIFFIIFSYVDIFLGVEMCVVGKGENYSMGVEVGLVYFKWLYVYKFFLCSFRVILGLISFLGVEAILRILFNLEF